MKRYTITNRVVYTQSGNYHRVVRGLGPVGSGMGRKFVFLVGWVGSWV